MTGVQTGALPILLSIYRLYLKASECAPTNHSDKRIWGEVILKPAIFRGYRTHSALVGLLIGCQSVTCQAQASQAPARNSEAADVDLADIVVTAQKRAERLRDVPSSEEHTSELQSLMRISYYGFCL